MFIVKLKTKQTSDDDIWLDAYEMVGNELKGLYNSRSGKVLRYTIPSENIAVISDVGERNSDLTGI